MHVANDTVASPRRWPVAGLSLFLAGLLLFGGLAAASRRFENQTEQRLLTQQTEQAGLVLTLAVDQYRAPLAGAARTAGATNGAADVFTSLLAPHVGPEGRYVRAALLRAGSPDPVVVVGEGDLQIGRAELEALIGEPSEPLRVAPLLDEGRLLGYAAHEPTAPDWVVYAERALSPNPTVRQRTDEPFSELNYAIYIGGDETSGELLSASTPDLPLTGRRAEVEIAFGDQPLHLVTTASGHLGNNEMQRLWWIVLGGGVLASIAVARLVERTLASRRRAQELAALTEDLYNDQRDMAESLQRSLLPSLTMAPPGTAIAARYWPAGTAHLVGGDFYDVFQIDADRWGILIGDVCGKGVEAAGLTGLARYTARAAAHYCQRPSEVLTAMHLALREQEIATFCTACLIVVTPDPSGGAHATVCLAGHPPPLVRRADGSVVEVGATGSLLGWFEPELRDVDIRLAAGDLIVLYTDGLTDAPGDQGVPLAEVYELVSARGAELPVGELADAIRSLKRRRRPHGSSDDTALLCVAFTRTAGRNDSVALDHQVAADAGHLE